MVVRPSAPWLAAVFLMVALAGCSTGPTPVPGPVSSSASTDTASSTPSESPSSVAPDPAQEPEPPFSPGPPDSGGGGDGGASGGAGGGGGGGDGGAGGGAGGGGGGGLNAGTPLRIPLPQDRLTTLKLPEAISELEQRISTECGGDPCVAVEVQATQEDPPTPGQSCDDVNGLAGTAEDEAGEPYVDTVAGGSVTLLTNIRCEDVPPAGPSDAEGETPDPTGNTPGAEDGGTGTEDGGPGTEEDEAPDTPSDPGVESPSPSPEPISGEPESPAVP